MVRIIISLAEAILHPECPEDMTEIEDQMDKNIITAVDASILCRECKGDFTTNALLERKHVLYIWHDPKVFPPPPPMKVQRLQGIALIGATNEHSQLIS